MKNILILLFFLISMSGFSQYPIKTVFKGDSVVIMTTDQFEGFDLMIANQKTKNDIYRQKNDKLSLINDSLAFVNDSLLVIFKKDSLIIDSITKRISTIEKWVMETAIDQAWLYYDWRDSTVRYVDLSMYAFYGNKHNGNISLFRRSGSIKKPDVSFWKQVNREYPQVFEFNWTQYYRKKRQPLLSKYPYNVITPYKPKKVIEIKLSE